MSLEPPDYIDNIVPFDGCSDEMPPHPFRTISLKEFAVLSESGWHIKRILPAAELIVAYGRPGSGKTFAVLDMVMAIARGIEWNGQKVKQGRVVYICAEGGNGFKNRLLAYKQHNNLDYDFLTSFEVIENSPNFLNEYDNIAVANQIGKASLIVVDTLARTMAGGDENNSKDMSNVIQKCQALYRATGATIVLIHHSGKDQDRGSRGWSGLLGAVDAEFMIEKLPSGHRITNTKQKDGDIYEPIGFTLTQIKIGTDSDGEPITSCAFNICTAPKTFDKDKKLGATEQLVFDVFKEFNAVLVSVEDLIDRVVKNIPYDSIGNKRDRRREMVKQALIGLQSRKILSILNNSVLKT